MRKVLTRHSGVGICSLLHLGVDGLCACQLYLLSAVMPAMQLVAVFLTYNLLAFLTQPFTGMWIDTMRRKHWMLLAANVLLAVAVLLSSLLITFGGESSSEKGVMLVAVLLGIGNSLFHVWGGKQTAVQTGNDITALGLFVSTGALGLAVGFVCCSWGLLYAFLLMMALLSVVYVLAESPCLQPSEQSAGADDAPSAGFSPLLVWTSILVIVLVVMFRSYAGGAFSAGTAKSQGFVLLLAATAMLGKMAGGWMAKHLGLVRAAVLMVVVASVCYCYRQWNVAVLLLGLFMVNCTMPITLYLANVLLKGHEGLAFGLLAAALIPGSLWMFF